MKLLKILVVAFLLFVIFFAFFKATAIKVVYASTPSLDEQYMDLAIKYRVDRKLVRSIAECESGSLGMVALGDNSRAKGKFQFHQGTWDNFTKQMGEELDIQSEYDQTKVIMWALANGYGSHWTSYVAIKNGGTYSFYSKLLGKHFTVKCSMVK